MTDLDNAATLRRWAMQCAAQADDPHASGDERDRLLKMRAALLDLAETQDWLDGGRRRSMQRQQPQQQQQSQPRSAA
ncbi:MAG TPA: hypothetical protein VJL90_07940 [Pseudorhodoplanes sp.]|nr:hypothetical protein [Pseudorhodoplanes sp.]